MATSAERQQRGRLIAVEGIDGSGKSTQAALLAEATGAYATHEPGATAIGQRLRALLLDPAVRLDARSETLLVLADRAQHVAEVVGPALAAGSWVVSDRFSPSTLAYQGYGRGLAVDQLAAMSQWASDGIEPDLVVLIDVPPEMAAGRRHRRASGRPSPSGAPSGAGEGGGGRREGAGEAPRPGPADRFEGESVAWQERVRQGFRSLAGTQPERWVVIDGAGSVAEVATAVRRAVAERLGAPPGGWR